MNQNISYKTLQLLQYYSCHRNSWNALYPSERIVIEKILHELEHLDSYSILDVGCACGGLASAFSERIKHNFIYNGIDINRDMIDWAKNHINLPIQTNFYCTDILEWDSEELYDVVFSLSCIDWNIETIEMLKKCWNKVKPGGYFILSIRLTDQKSINNIEQAYQYIQFNKEQEEEKANYVIFRFDDIMHLFLEVGNGFLDSIYAYGYWGQPSKTAFIPYNRLCFSVFALRKGLNVQNEIQTHLQLPLKIILT